MGNLSFLFIFLIIIKLRLIDWFIFLIFPTKNNYPQLSLKINTCSIMYTF